MADRPTTASIAKELMLSRWLFAIFSVIAGLLSAVAYFILNRVEGGWIVATFVGALAWALVDHFGKQLSSVAAAEAENPKH